MRVSKSTPPEAEATNNVVDSPTDVVPDDIDATSDDSFSRFTSSSTRRRRKSKSFGQPEDLLASFIKRNPRILQAPSKLPTSKAPKRVALGAKVIDETDSVCGSQETFYRCSNGFVGCCAVNPCTSTATYPGTAPARIQSSAQALTTRLEELVEASRVISRMGSGTEKPTTSRTRNSQKKSRTTAAPSLSTESDTAPAAPTFLELRSASSPPACPDSNSQLWRDDAGIAYRIHCDVGNLYPSYNNITVHGGGLAQCFSECSKTSKCAGFAYVGENSGVCRLKEFMPRHQYFVKDNAGYIAYSKLHPKAHASPSTDATSAKSSAPLGLIIGAVLGGIAVIALLAWLVTLYIKRKSKQVEEHQDILISHVVEQPVEPPRQYIPPTHQRHVSTSHDLYGPQGGVSPAQQGYPSQAERLRSSIQMQRTKPGTAPGLVAEGFSPTLPARTYWQPPLRTQAHEMVPVTYQPAPAPISPRSPRFYEHFEGSQNRGNPTRPPYSPADSSVAQDSPTLGYKGTTWLHSPVRSRRGG